MELEGTVSLCGENVTPGQILVDVHTDVLDFKSRPSDTNATQGKLSRATGYCFQAQEGEARGAPKGQ